MLKSWIFFSLITYINLDIGICGDADKSTTSPFSRSGDTVSKDRTDIPDLNVPLEGLFAEQGANLRTAVESRYAKKVRRLKDQGKWEEYRAKERVRLQKHYQKLSPAKKIAKSRRSTNNFNERMKKVSIWD